MTDKRILDWLDAKKRTQVAIEIEEILYLNTEKIPFPKNTKPATERDMQVGNIIWYRPEGFDVCWKYVAEVIAPSDMYKAFYAEDSARYGLKNAYIEISEADNTIKIGTVFPQTNYTSTKTEYVLKDEKIKLAQDLLKSLIPIKAQEEIVDVKEITDLAIYLTNELYNKLQRLE